MAEAQIAAIGSSNVQKEVPIVAWTAPLILFACQTGR
jgi:hypothetical protein